MQLPVWDTCTVLGETAVATVGQQGVRRRWGKQSSCGKPAHRLTGALESASGTLVDSACSAPPTTSCALPGDGQACCCTWVLVPAWLPTQPSCQTHMHPMCGPHRAARIKSPDPPWCKATTQLVLQPACTLKREGSLQLVVQVKGVPCQVRRVLPMALANTTPGPRRRFGSCVLQAGAGVACRRRSCLPSRPA